MRGSAMSSLRRAGHGDAAGLEDVAAVGDLQRAEGVLLDEEHGDVERLHALHHVEDLGDEDRGEAHRRLVEQEARGAAHQRAGDGEHLLLAAGEAAGDEVALLLQDREHGEGVRHVLLHPVVGVEEGAEAQVLLDRQVGEDLPALGRLGEAVADALVGRDGGEALAAEGDGAAGDRLDAGEAAQERRLAGAVGADDGDDLAGVDREVDAVQHLDAAVARAQALDVKHGSPPLPR